MAVQPPFRSDAYEVENADAAPGPRLIEAYIPDGSLRFTDPRVPSGINLAELAGLQQLHNTVVVSQTGIGASKDVNGNPITTIQGGLDAVSDSADENDPWTVFIAPGLYVEDIYLIKDGVTLYGLGTVRIRNATGVSTIRVRQGVLTVPRRITLYKLRIENVTAVQACVDINSALFASGSFTIVSVPNIGDIANVDGTTFTAIAIGSVPAPGEFELGVDEPTTAVNLAEAINDPVNGLNSLVIAIASGSVVIIRALNDGVAGNTITLSSTVPLIILPSGATLTGGAAAGPGSTVGDGLIQILDCDLVPLVVSGYQLRASSINNIYVEGGNWNDSSTGATFEVNECARCDLRNVRCQNLILNYDNTNPNLPSIGTSSYSLTNVFSSGVLGLATGYVGVGSIVLTDCVVIGTTVYSGSAPAQSFTARRCSFGAMSVGGASPVTVLSNCTRGALVGLGTGTLSETTTFGSASFVGVPVVTVPFSEPQPNLSYTVLLEQDGPPGAITDIPSVPSAAKTTTSFDIAFGAPQVTTVNFVVKRNV